MKEKKQPRQIELTYSERVILAAMLGNRIIDTYKFMKFCKKPAVTPEELIELFNKVSDVKWGEYYGTPNDRESTKG